MDLKDGVVLVTGGGSGLGEATVTAVIERGAKAFIFDLNEDACRAAVDRHGASHCAYALTDVSDEDAVNAGLNQLIKAFGKLDAVVNCAGIGLPAKVLDRAGNPLSLAAFRSIVEINLVGTFNVLSKSAARMITREPANEDGSRGVIVNVASIAAFDGQIGQPAYASSKAGIVGLTLPVARELARYGIRVNAIAPGLFLTPLAKSLGEPVLEALGSRVEFPRRLGKPEEFAQLAIQIIENDYLNGEVIRLDGAIRMQAK